MVSDFLNSLSVRARNVCSSEGIYTEHDLTEFVQEHGINALYQLRNCGRKTVEELVEIYEYLCSKPSTSSQVNEYLSVFESEVRFKLLKLEFDRLFQLLSIRAQNFFKSKYGREIDIVGYIQNEIIKKTTLFEFSNPTSKSSVELNIFSNKIEKTLQELDSDSDLDSEDIILIELTLALGIKPLEKDLDNFIHGGNFSIVEFMEFFAIPRLNLAAEDVIYLTKYTTYPIDNIPQQIRILISEEMGLSTERVRQRLVQTAKRLPIIISKLKSILRYHNSYKLFIEQPYSYLKEINFSNFEPVNSNNYFLKSINYLGLLLSDSYYLIQVNTELKKLRGVGDYEYYKRHKNFNINALINKDFISKDIFFSEMNQVFEILCQKRKRDEIYEIKNPVLESKQIAFLTEFMSFNFEVESLGPGRLLIPQNKNRNIADILVEILSIKDEPLSLEEIYDEYRDKSDRKIKDNVDHKQSLMSSLGRDERIVVLRGALSSGKSQYGLKKWEDEGRIISGSIIDLCVNYITSSELPIHPLELSRFVMKHRNTNLKNILTNIKLNSINDFETFEGGFIGMKSKTYPEAYIKSLVKINPHHSHAIILFLKEQHYYNYSELIKKFSKEFGLKEIQIEGIIQVRIDLRQLEIKDENIHYLNSFKDQLVSEIFNIEKYDLSGFNPYRIEINNQKTLCLVLENHGPNDSINGSDEFIDSVKRESWDFLILINLDRSSGLVKVSVQLDSFYDNTTFLDSWEEFGKHFLQLSNREFYTSEVTNVYDFIENYILGTSYSKVNNDRIDRIREKINLNGLSEIEAISEILNLVYDIDGEDISMTEARKIYSTLKLE